MTDAGRGARQQQAAARRQVEEAERRLATARAREHAWSAGADGEEQVADALLELEQLGWVVLHDVAWPGRPRANLDHVLIGPGGVLIVDTKNWSGTVTVDPVRGLRSGGYRKTKEVDAVEAARRAVLPLVPALSPGVVSGLICLAAQGQDPVRLTNGVVVVGRSRLAHHVRGLPVMLSAQTVMDVSLSLGPALRRSPDGVPRQATRAGRSTGRQKPRGRKQRGIRGDLVKLAVLGLIVGALALFPDQIIRAYTSAVTAVVTPVAEDIVGNLEEGAVTPPAPAP